MKTFGIISVPTDKKGFRARALRTAEIKEIFGSNPRYIVAEIAYTREELMRMRGRFIKKAVIKADKELKRRGAENVFLAENFKSIVRDSALLSEYEHNRIYKIPANKIFMCYKYLKQKTCELSSQRARNSLIISDSKLRAVTIENLADVCMDARHIVLRTEEEQRAKSLADILFKEYGVLIKIECNDGSGGDNSSYFLIDADAGKVRAGDCLADGAELVSNSGIYALDPAEEAFYLGDENVFDIKSLLLGKNKLKIS